MDAVSLEWQRCRDGTEWGVQWLAPKPNSGGVLPDYEERGWLVAASGRSTEDAIDALSTRYGDGHASVKLRNRSERMEAYSLRLNPNRPLVLDFINARTPDALADFASEHGLPTSGRTVELDKAKMARELFEAMVRVADDGDKATAAEVFDHVARVFTFAIRPRLLLSHARPSMQLEPNNLLGFMLLEAGVWIAGGEKLLTCTHCRGWFVKRRTSAYCSPRCRMAASRANDAERKPRFSADAV